jgi:myo-inositol-1(or 4)-monophosphatase
MENHLQFAERLARQAGSVLLEYYRKASFATRLKEDRTLVTEADLAADELIASSIKQAFPLESIISEEMHTISPQDVSAVWVIDPLDGTTNFSLGIPFWGVSIARLVDGWPDTAAIYFPILGEMYTAQKGRGTWFNDEQLHLDPSEPARLGSFFACCSRAHRRYDITIPYKPRIFGSAAYNFCILARRIALLVFEAAPKIWDISGAWLVVCEAGGVIQPLNGPMAYPVSPLTDYRKQNFPTLAALSIELETQATSQIQPKPRTKA